MFSYNKIYIIYVSHTGELQAKKYIFILNLNIDIIFFLFPKVQNGVVRVPMLVTTMTSEK